MIKNIYWFSRKVSTGYFCQILMKLEFPRQSFEKPSNIKFDKNPSSERRVVPCGRTDIANLIVHSSQICEKRLRSKILKWNANIHFTKQSANEGLICNYFNMSTVSFEHLQSIST